MNRNIVCYKCNNLGHKARDFRIENAPIIKTENPTMKWESKKNEGCNIALITEDKEDEWYIESGFSTHMTGDQNKFVSLKEKSNSIAFGDDSSINILGKGVESLGSEHMKEQIFLLVKYLKHNLLNVGKMCDQGYNPLFDSWKCKIK